jgi:hypothetical protein
LVALASANRAALTQGSVRETTPNCGVAEEVRCVRLIACLIPFAATYGAKETVDTIGGSILATAANNCAIGAWPNLVEPEPTDQIGGALIGHESQGSRAAHGQRECDSIRSAQKVEVGIGASVAGEQPATLS